MIKDITLGQYFPGNSMVHRLDPRYKIIISGIFIAMLFIGDHVICLEIGAVFVAMALILSSIPLKMIVKSIKPIIPLLLFTSLFNIFFISGGMPIFEWKFIKITDAAVHTTFFIGRDVLGIPAAGHDVVGRADERHERLLHQVGAAGKIERHAVVGAHALERGRVVGNLIPDTLSMYSLVLIFLFHIIPITVTICQDTSYGFTVLDYSGINFF